MDARERLRRYLEQRRELGESELVLDQMAVDELMQLLGAHSVNTRARSSSAQGAAPTAAAVARTSHEPPVAPPPPAPVTQTVAAQAAQLQAPPPMRSAPPPLPTMRTVDAPSAAPTISSTPEPLRNPPAWLRDLGAPLGFDAAPDTYRSAPEIASLASLQAIADAVRTCTRCPLYATARNPVPGVGPVTADFMCVGEAPGETEDAQGIPFVGAAGQLLTKILVAIQLPREDVFICNVLKHRPPGNRDPLPHEVEACAPYLLRQLDLVRPKVILGLGSFAARTLLGTTLPIGKLRGQVHRFAGVPLVVTYHPAALLRNEAWKRPAWEDVQLARRILDASRAATA